MSLGALGGALAHDCGDAPNKAQPAPPAKNAEGGPLWTQVFGSWTCTAAGRPEFRYTVTRKSELGSAHEWADQGTGETLPATVDLTQLYLMKGATTPFRNFEYKTEQPEVLAWMDEWSLTAAGEAPYHCVKR